MEKDWVAIYNSNHSVKINLIKSMLEANGVQVVLLSSKDSAYHFGDIDLFVRRDDVIKAKKLIENNTP